MLNGVEEIPSITKSRVSGMWLVTNVTKAPNSEGYAMRFSTHQSCVRWLELMAEKGRVHPAWVYRTERNALVRAAMVKALKQFDEDNDVMGGAR